MTPREKCAIGIKKGMMIDSDTAHNQRSGGDFICRISYQSGGVFDKTTGTGVGATFTTTPYGFCHDINTDVQENDLIEWRGQLYQVGSVSKPHLFGNDICIQFQLTEVSIPVDN